MTFTGVNATGWTELMNGTMIPAVYTMYNTSFAGWVITILFILYQVMLYLKTGNLSLGFVTGVVFISMYAFTVDNFIKNTSIWVMFFILVFQLAAILYYTFWK